MTKKYNGKICYELSSKAFIFVLRFAIKMLVLQPNTFFLKTLGSTAIL